MDSSSLTKWPTVFHPWVVAFSTMKNDVIMESFWRWNWIIAKGKMTWNWSVLMNICLLQDWDLNDWTYLSFHLAVTLVSNTSTMPKVDQDSEMWDWWKLWESKLPHSNCDVSTPSDVYLSKFWQLACCWLLSGMKCWRINTLCWMQREERFGRATILCFMHIQVDLVAPAN